MRFPRVWRDVIVRMRRVVDMKIQLISQASVLIRCTDCVIWTDPWLVGKAFNNSWSLHPKPDFQMEWLDEIDFLWISHEHPDHFNIPTLKMLPQEWKQRVVVLFQDKSSDRMVQAFQRFGFQNIRLMKHATVEQLTTQTKAFIYQVGVLDSSLGVLNEGQTVVNINDCELNDWDKKSISKLCNHSIDVLLNQFSLAGNNGPRDHETLLTEKAKHILDTVVVDHRTLHAKCTLPFASFMYFSSETNRYINKYHNTVETVYQRFQQEQLRVKFLYINDTMDIRNLDFDDQEARDRYREDQSDFEALDYDSYPKIPVEDIQQAFLKRADQLHSAFVSPVINRLGRMTAYVVDHACAVSFSVADKQFQVEPDLPENQADLIIHSQPLHQAFQMTWGVQTIGVGAQYFIEKNTKTWRWYRMITSLNNAEVHLNKQSLRSSGFWKYVYQRSKGNGVGQLLFRVKKAL